MIGYLPLNTALSLINIKKNLITFSVDFQPFINRLRFAGIFHFVVIDESKALIILEHLFKQKNYTPPLFY